MNSLASTASIFTATTVANGTALDIFADFSIALASAAFVAPNYIGVYLFPLNGDGSTYGDGNFTLGTKKTATPSPQYYKGGISILATTAAQQGTLMGIVIPPGTFAWGIQNMGGVALASSGNASYYRTYNRSIA